MTVAQVLRNPRHSWLLASQVLATSAGTIYQFALPLVAFDLTGSTGMAGVITGVSIAGSVVFGIPAGTYADRHSRTRIVCLVLLLQTVFYAALSALLGFGALSGLFLVVFGIGVSISGTLLVPSFTGLLRSVVPKEAIKSAYIVHQGRIYAVSIIVPPLAGLLYGLSGTIALGVAAGITFIGSLTVLLIRPNSVSPVQGRKDSSFILDMVRGLTYVRRSVRVWTAALGGASINFGINGALLVIVLYLAEGGRAPVEIALVETLSAAGAVIGVFLAEKILKAFSVRTVVIMAGTVFSLACIIGSSLESPIALGVAFAIPAVVLTAWNSAVFGGVIASVEESLQGRVQSVVQLTAGMATPVAAAAGGLLLNFFGFSFVMIAFAAAILLGTGVQLVGIARSVETDPGS